MIKYLIQRPVAVLMCFGALVVTGCLLIWKIPVSLLPDVDVPQIIVRVHYPNNNALIIEQNALKPIRENLANLHHIRKIESMAANHSGLVYLNFEHGTQMNLAYIEINEKLDRLSNSLPRDMQRPQVMRINTSDIPVIRIQVMPRDGTDLIAVTDLCEKVLKKRVEQLDGVSLVDINGRRHAGISITPDEDRLRALHMQEDLLAQTIQYANQEIGGLSLKDGQYRYFIKLSNSLPSPEAIGQLPVQTKDGNIFSLHQLAQIDVVPEAATGYHLFNGREGLVITVQKQTVSRMNDLVPRIRELVAQFGQDYPQIDFALSQDQTFLLDAGIDNLVQDLIYGGILTVLLLFLFFGHYASPLLMGISIPLSLIITFIFFYFLDISFNIISLSGLTLGIGMLIDNSIVVIDNITRKRQSGLDMLESSTEGTREVVAPVISQMLTTVAVYAPLILLSGIAGALVADQSIALTISLLVSLGIAFVLAPLLYRLLLRGSPQSLNNDTLMYQKVAACYHRMINFVLRHRVVCSITTLLLMPAGLWIATRIPVSSLPAIEKKESLVTIDWNASIDVQENLRRIQALQSVLQTGCRQTEAEIGIKQFLLQQDNHTMQNAELYFLCENEPQKMQQDALLKSWLQQFYPKAIYRITDAPNAFTQLFTNTTPFMEVRFRPLTHDKWQQMDTLLQRIATLPFKPGHGLLSERSILLVPDGGKMTLYGIKRSMVESRLQQLYGTYPVTELKRFGDVKPVALRMGNSSLSALDHTQVKGSNEAYYPLSSVVDVRYSLQPKFITADRSGEYRSVIFEDRQLAPAELEHFITPIAAQYGFKTAFAGQYYDNKTQLNRLWLILLIGLVLLYIILAVQYESLVLPLLVMLTIPLGITGGMFLLWVTGGTLDVMAAIGFIVILGLIVDDPILKIETLNRLRKKYAAAGLPADDALLERMIHEAGSICLRPLLMVSLTTSIAMVPVLFISGIGNDLQKPLVYVIIGGLTIGTFFTTWFIPLAYWYLYKWRKPVNA